MLQHKGIRIVWMKLFMYVQIVLYIFHPFVGTMVPRMFAVIILLVQVLYYIIRQRKIPFLRYINGYIVFSIYGVMTMLWCVSQGNAYQRIVDLFFCICFSLNLCIYCFRHGAKKAKIQCEEILNVYLFSMCIMVALCYLAEGKSLLSWARLGKTIYSGKSTNQIVFTCYLIVAVYISIKKVFEATSVRSRVLFTICAGWLYLSCILTGVRKIVILPLIFLYVYLLLSNRKYAVKIIGITIIVPAISAVLLYLAMNYSNSFASRMNALFLQLQGKGVEASYDERSWLRMMAVKCFNEYPLLGIGLGNFRNYSVMHGGPDLYAHNNWVEVLSTTGIIGFLIYYGNQFVLFFRILKSRMPLAVFFTAFIISNWACDYYQVSFYSEPLVMMFSLAAVTEVLVKSR